MNIKFSSIAGVFAVPIFISSILFASYYSNSFHNWYTTNEYFDWQTMAISHFGVSNLAIPFTFIVSLVSMLSIYFILGVKKAYGNTDLVKKGAVWIIAGYIALPLAFLSMLYQPHAPLSIGVHFLFATIYFVCIPIGIMFLGFYFIKNRKTLLGYSSLVLGSLAFIFGPIICIGSSLLLGNKGVAIPEFIQILCEDLWIILVSIDILRATPLVKQSS